jgi:hypothetical protein
MDEAGLVGRGELWGVRVVQGRKRELRCRATTTSSRRIEDPSPFIIYLCRRNSDRPCMFASFVEHRPAAEPVTCGEDVLVLLNDGANILTAIDAFRKPALCSIFRTRHRDD